ncbi:hypothetical protein EW145_g5574 [Phellinidium pouzarii]|uniref:FAD-binding FR-type domain-containing protein n=1 Tax=Phellinidium pouzarii TaxID=167371 RepID=A0A4S4L0T6_9AGAM|nr:hypothetical protein EW145_g5574 [Phellinidium pouzarii]
MSDAPPSIPAEFQVYNSYVTDPIFQRKFSIVWGSIAGVAIILSLPHFVKSVRSGHLSRSIAGIWEDLHGWSYEPIAASRNVNSTGEKTGIKRSFVKKFVELTSAAKSLALWTAPGLGLDLGQIILVVAYFVTLLLCITIQSELVDNPNRAGFMAIAQLPVIFLLATKNSPLSLLLGAGHGWEKLNFLHRWAGRGMFLSAAVHGSLWIRNHLQYGIQILGSQKETSGVACFALLGIITLSSLKVVRAFAYQVFFIVHMLAVIALFITICYHTIYAVPYIFPPLAFYGLDLVLRLLRFRVKDATLIAPDNQMTIVRVLDCDGGWAAGQHVRLRVFAANRVFESHPLTMMSAPPRTSCLPDRALFFGARVRGDWSRALNEYAHANALPQSASDTSSELTNVAVSDEIVVEGSDAKVDLSLMEPPSKAPGLKAGANMKEFLVPEKPSWAALAGAQVQVMIDGPYGGCRVDLGEFSRVLFVAGGSGVTFTLGLLDDIVGRCLRLGRSGGERTSRIEFVWYMKSYACIDWVAPLLTEIALRADAEESSLDLHISIFVTYRPSVAGLVDALAGEGSAAPCCERGGTVCEKSGCCGAKSGKSVCTCKKSATGVSADSNMEGGGLAVCTAGPEGMTRETKNAVARLALLRAHRLGRIECHTEVYTL